MDKKALPKPATGKAKINKVDVKKYKEFKKKHAAPGKSRKKPAVAEPKEPHLITLNMPGMSLVEYYSKNEVDEYVAYFRNNNDHLQMAVDDLSKLNGILHHNIGVLSAMLQGLVEKGLIVDSSEKTDAIEMVKKLKAMEAPNGIRYPWL